METPKDLSIQRIKCKGLVIGLNLPPISHHFHWCRSMVVYVSNIAIDNKEEYNIDNFLRTKIYNDKDYDKYIDDYQQVRKEYDMLPDNVKQRIFGKEKVKVVFNYTGGKTSGYNHATKEILLLPDVEEGKFIHEVGHALFYTLKVDKYKSYQDIVNNIINNSSIKKFDDKAFTYYGLDSKYNTASHYQTFLGYDKLTAQLRLNQKNLIETMSEAYREYYGNKNQSLELNKLVEEVENNA